MGWETEGWSSWLARDCDGWPGSMWYERQQFVSIYMMNGAVTLETISVPQRKHLRFRLYMWRRLEENIVYKVHDIETVFYANLGSVKLTMVIHCVSPSWSILIAGSVDTLQLYSTSFW